MKHRLIARLLKAKRHELGEKKITFAKRIYPDLLPDSARYYYSRIENEQMDIPDGRISYAAELLGVPTHELETC